MDNIYINEVVGAQQRFRVKLIAATKPDKHMGADISTGEELIAYCARVSNPKNQENKSTAKKLLNYCLDNNHWSIFEMVHVVMEIETTRDISRQILRHRSFSFQEFSQRYADPTQELTFITREARLQDTKNRQNSIEVDNPELQEKWEELQKIITDDAKDAYNWAIANGIAKEQARAILPEGLTMTRLYMAGSLRSWIHYCHLRMDAATQKEHREIAEAAYKILLDQFEFLKDDISQ